MFAESIERLWMQLFGSLSPKDGLPATTIRSSEDSLALAIPTPLHDFYRLLGRNRIAMRSHACFRKPSELERVRDCLVFCDENQDVVYWAVAANDLSLADPPVVQGNYEEDAWYPDCPSLSHFLLQTLCWQAMSAMPSSATAKTEVENLSRISSKLERVRCGPVDIEYDFQGFSAYGLVVCAFPRHGNLYVGAKSDGHLKQFEQEFALSLDCC